jgi:hypothetical protein
MEALRNRQKISKNQGLSFCLAAVAGLQGAGQAPNKTYTRQGYDFA